MWPTQRPKACSESCHRAVLQIPKRGVVQVARLAEGAQCSCSEHNALNDSVGSLTTGLQRFYVSQASVKMGSCGHLASSVVCGSPSSSILEHCCPLTKEKGRVESQFCGHRSTRTRRSTVSQQTTNPNDARKSTLDVPASPQDKIVLGLADPHSLDGDLTESNSVYSPTPPHPPPPPLPLTCTILTSPCTSEGILASPRGCSLKFGASPGAVACSLIPLAASRSAKN